MSEDDKYDPFAVINIRLAKLEAIVFKEHERVPSQPSLTISSLKDGDKDLKLKVNVVTVGDVKKSDDDAPKAWRLQIIRIGDHTGQIDLQLWDDMIDDYKHIMMNDTIIVSGCYVKEYKGKLQLRISNGGKIEVLGGHIL